MKIPPALTAVVLSLAVATAGCATDEPRYAPPPPGSHSPFSEPDERGTDDPMRDTADRNDEQGDEEGQEEEEEDPDLPPPDRQ